MDNAQRKMIICERTFRERERKQQREREGERQREGEKRGFITKYRSRFVYIVIEYKAKNRIYKPFKWDNDDITWDLCMRATGTCIDIEIPTTKAMVFLL